MRVVECLQGLLLRIVVLCSVSGLVMTGQVFAQSLPTPEEVLERARVSRSEFSDLVFELQAALPDLATKERMAPYLAILRELREIQVELNFAAMDVDMILELAEKMTLYIAPQMDITSDPEPLLRDFVSWSDDSRLTEFCQDQEVRLGKVSGVQEIFRILGRIASLIALVEKPDSLIKRFSHSADDFSKLQGHLHQRLIEQNLPELPVAEYGKFLDGVRRVAAIQGGFDTFVKTAYETSDTALLSRIVQMMTLCWKRLGQLDEFVPEDVITRPGVVVGSVVLKVVEAGGVLDDDVISAALEIMYPGQIDALGLGLRTLDMDRVQPAQFRMLTGLAQRISAAYGSFNLPTQQRLMEDLAGRFDLGQKVSERDLEGFYEIEIEGRPGVFTFARTGQLGLVVSVGYQHITASMAYGSYDRSNDIFNATSVRDTESPTDTSTGQPEIPLQYVKFRISDDGVSGLLRIGHKEQKFTGRRVSLVKDYLQAVVTDPVALEEFTGSYEGMFMGYKSILKITSNGPSHVASLVISPDAHNNLITLDAVYLDPDNGALYLTSRQRTVFFQVRGRLERGRISGQFVIGGKSAPMETTFVKVSDDQIE